MTNSLRPPQSSSTSKWEIYDQLIAQIPEDKVVADAMFGIHWTLVRSEGVGMAMTPPAGDRSIPGAGSFKGRPLRELANLAKSWHPYEAALGVAALNAHYNTQATLAEQWAIPPDPPVNESIFTTMKEQVAGKKVTVVGHFPDLEPLGRICQLSILERHPLNGDFPDPACEYILEDQDSLFITGVTLINKTLPRLLELGHRTQIVLVGPSVPLTPQWFEWGVASLAGTTVMDGDRVWMHVAQGGDRSVFNHGARMVKLSPKNQIHT
ncbi:MAG: hypothetical protein H6Q00_122 [Holophagaceae bacterium]|nr:hypothetical protein [Holophagaceae bacterium]